MQEQDNLRVIGYTRVSVGSQEESGHGLEAQGQAIKDATARRGWNLIAIVREAGSGKDLEREELYGALERIVNGEADALVVAKLDRVTRSLLDFAHLLQWFEDAGVALIALDFDLDTSTPTGELMAHIIIAVAQWERRAIAQRTKDALASMRARGLKTNEGNVSDDFQLTETILAMRARGMTLWQIADKLNEIGVPTIRGGKQWRQSTLQTITGYRRPHPKRKTVALPEIKARPGIEPGHRGFADRSVSTSPPGR